MSNFTKMPIVRLLARRAALAIEWRIDERVQRQTDELVPRIEGLEGRADHAEHADRRHSDDIETLRQEVLRIAPHVAAIEKRLGDIAERRGASAVEDGDRAEELDAIRAEHARVRARLTAVSKFEERLRRLEDATATHAATADAASAPRLGAE